MHSIIGKRIRLIHMQDDTPLSPGANGTITGIDALGDYLIDWDNGSSLKIIPEIDTFEVLSPARPDNSVDSQED